MVYGILVVIWISNVLVKRIVRDYRKPFNSANGSRLLITFVRNENPAS